MFNVLLQIWGGAFYLFNKICFSRAERNYDTAKRQAWRVRSWIVYLMGLPAWIAVFIFENNWIAAGVEAGGAPSMIVGLVIAKNGQNKDIRWLDNIARIAVGCGLLLSVYQFGGITTANQILELGVALGFLMGTYFLAKNRPPGYFWLMAGNISCSALMGIQGYFLLMVQQVLSLVFVADAYRMQHRLRHTKGGIPREESRVK